MEPLEFFRQLASALEQGAIARATVVKVQGSTPRELGASLFLTEMGKRVGTVGGGAGEAKVLAQARAVLAGNDPQWVTIDLTGSCDRETEGVCGGMMDLWLDRWQGTADQAIAAELYQRLAAGRIVQLTTRLPTRSRSSGLHLQQSRFVPSRGLELLVPEIQFSEISACLLPRVRCRDDCLVELLLPPPLLLIVGAGHVGVALAQLADLAGFRIGLVDDRPEVLEGANLRPEPLVKALTLAEALLQLKNYPAIYVALVTRNVQQDLTALETLRRLMVSAQEVGQDAAKIWPQNLCYLGMIGSQRRINWVRQAFRDQSLESSVLDRLHAPIGLEIGALTPAEIAVSICAELIQVRRRGERLQG